MVMAENESGDDQNSSTVGPKSPWKSPVVADAPVMGAAEFWPALSDAQQQQQQHRSKLTDSASKTPPQPPLMVAGGGDKAAPPAASPRGSAGQHKSHGSGYTNTSNKHASSRHKKSGSKRNPNGAPPFSMPFPYQQPAMSPVFPAMAPPPHFSVSGYPYQPGPASFPTVETHLIKSGSETGPPMQPFAPSINVQPPPRGDPNAYAVNFPNRRPNMQDSGGHLNPTWHHQRAFGSRDNIPLQQVMGPRPLVRPPFLAAPPGYMIGPTFPGPPPICYVSVAPPGSLRGPQPSCFVPYPINSGASVLPQETIALRASIAGQIEYYFSDENLKNDHYLISLMDDQGWVPVSTIAEFKRVKKMTVDISFILDALKCSGSIEVKGDKVRKRDNWSKWIPASSQQAVSLKAQASEGQAGENAEEDDTISVSKGSAGFAKTLMLDEELELGQKTLKNDECSPVRRVENREEEVRGKS